MSRVLAVVVFTGLSVLVGCSGGSSSHGAAPSSGFSKVVIGSSPPTESSTAPASTSSAGSSVPVSDACKLLSPADVQGAFGGTVGDGQSTVDQASGQAICNWTVTAADGSGFGVELDVHTNQSPGAFDQQRQVAQGQTATVGGLGDGAFTEMLKQDSFIFSDVWVRHGSTTFRLEALEDTPPDPLELLARKVLAQV